MDADLWKDGLFKSKVTRYLCFTRSFSKENVSLVVAFPFAERAQVIYFLFEISSGFVVVYFHCHMNLSKVLGNWVESAANAVFHLLTVLLNSYRSGQ